MDVKRIVAFVLLCSSIGMVFFVFYVLLNTSDEDLGDETPTWWRGNSYAGSVVDIDRNHLTVHTHGGDNLDFRLDPSTRFLLWGNIRVEPGVEVKVLFRSIRAGNTSYLVARTVKVLRHDTSASPSAGPSSAASPAATGSPQPHSSDAPAAAGSTAPQPTASSSSSAPAPPR